MKLGGFSIPRATRSWIATSVTLAVLLPFIGASTAPAASIYFSYGSKSCPSSASCRVNSFSKVATGKTLTPTRASCSLRVSKSALIKYVQVGYTSGTNAYYAGPFLSPIMKNSEDATYAYYDLNSEFLIPISAGYKPLITLYLAAAVPSIVFNCTVSGTLTP